MRELHRLRIGIVNLIASSLPDDVLSALARSALYSLVGVRLGAKSRVQGGCWIGGSGLSIGTEAYVGRNCYFDLTDTVTLGDNVVVGHGSTFVTAEHAIGPAGRRAGSVTARPIHVKVGSWIGANCTVLPGVVIGSGSVVAAGSVVAEDVPSGSLVGGVPARILRALL